MKTKNDYKKLETAKRSGLMKDSAKKRKESGPDKLKRAAILQFTRYGKFVREYSSMIEAAKELGIKTDAISRCFYGKQQIAGGFQWRYKIDPNFDDGIFDIPPVKDPRLKLQGVVQYNLEGKFIREYPSATEAANIVNIQDSSIYSCVKKEITHAGGFQWRSRKEVVKDGKIIDIEPVKSHARYYRRPVCQFKPGGAFVREYRSIIEAAEETKINKYYILLCTLKKHKSTFDYQWRFKEEVLKNGKIMDLELTESNTPHFYRALCQFSLGGKFIREYPSIMEADEKIKKNKFHIVLCTKKKGKSCDGFQWRFKDEVLMKDGKIMDIGPTRRYTPHLLKQVCQFGLDGKFIREFPSIGEASNETEADKYTIYKCVRKKLKTTAGFQWRYKDEVLKDGKIMDIEPVKRFTPYFRQPVCPKRN